MLEVDVRPNLTGTVELFAMIKKPGVRIDLFFLLVKFSILKEACCKIALLLQKVFPLYLAVN